MHRCGGDVRATGQGVGEPRRKKGVDGRVAVRVAAYNLKDGGSGARDLREWKLPHAIFQLSKANLGKGGG